MRLARVSRAGALGEVSFGEGIFVEGVEEGIVAIVGADDSDDLWKGLLGAEGFCSNAAVGPAGAEALDGRAVRGPCGATENHLWLDLDGERSCTEDIAVPIHDAACGGCVDFDFLRSQFRPPCDRLRLNARTCARGEQRR